MRDKTVYLCHENHKGGRLCCVQSMFHSSGQTWTTFGLLILVAFLFGVHCKSPNVVQNMDLLKVHKQGPLPYHFYRNGEVKGSDVKLIEVLSGKLNFTYKKYMLLTKDYKFKDVVAMVI